MRKLTQILNSSLSVFCITFSHASALDISGQSVSSFLQEGNYAEVSYSVIDTHVKGDQSLLSMQDTIHNIDAHNQAFTMSLKKQFNPQLSLGLLYDQPFQLDSNYYEKNKSLNKNLPNMAKAQINTESLTLLVGYQLNPNFSVFAGPAYQRLKGSFDLYGQAFGLSGAYAVKFNPDEAFGYVVGATYGFPDYHLKMDLSYRSEIKHNLNTAEKIDFPLILDQPLTSLSQSSVYTPESINMNIQMGVYHNTLLILNSRWVNWNTFTLRPDLFSKAAAFIDTNNNLNLENGSLLNYNKDQWSVNLGVARKFSDQWAGLVFGGRDSGDSILNDNSRAESWLTGLILQYKLMQKYELNAGLIYIKLKDSTQEVQEDILSKRMSQIKNIEYSNNDAFSYLFKFGYRF